MILTKKEVAKIIETIFSVIIALIVIYFILGLFWAVLVLGAIILVPIVRPIVKQYI